MVKLTNEMFRHVPKRKKMSYLYFILDKNQNAVKIGISKDPQTRLRNFNGANLNELELLVSVIFPQKNIREVEKDFHKLFEEYSIRNEWFRYNSSIEIAVEILKKKGYRDSQ